MYPQTNAQYGPAILYIYDIKELITELIPLFDTWKALSQNKDHLTQDKMVDLWLGITLHDFQFVTVDMNFKHPQYGRFYNFTRRIEGSQKIISRFWWMLSHARSNPATIGSTVILKRTGNTLYMVHHHPKNLTQIYQQP